MILFEEYRLTGEGSSEEDPNFNLGMPGDETVSPQFEGHKYEVIGGSTTQNPNFNLEAWGD